MANNYYDYYYKEPSTNKIRAAFRGKIIKPIRKTKYYSTTATRDENGNPVIVITFNPRSEFNKYKKPSTIYLSNKPRDYSKYSVKTSELGALKVFEFTLQHLQEIMNGNITNEIRRNFKQYLYHYNKDAELMKKIIIEALNDKDIDVLDLILQLLEENKDKIIDNNFINEEEFDKIKTIFTEIIELKPKQTEEQSKEQTEVNQESENSESDEK